MAFNLNAVITGAIGTMLSMILSIISVFVVFFFLPLLNSSTFLTSGARDIVEDVYPIILVLVPLFTFLGGMVVTVLVISKATG